MKLKDHSVNPIGLRPEMLLALMVSKDVYNQHGFELVITSLNDGRHSETSLHYSGCGVDLRTIAHDPAYGWDNVADEIRRKLNKHYDVINEKDHIHIEYQPRRDG